MLKKLFRIVEKPVTTLLGTAENAFSTVYTLKHPPTFIIGPPRSGTTLFGQVLSHAFDISYMSNFTVRMRNTYNKLPPIVTATRIAKLLGYLENSDEKFESYYGSSTNPGGSSDSDFIWRNILPMGYLEKGCLTEKQQRYIYRVTAGVEHIFGKPFVDKCVGHSLRIPALLEIFPDALFIRCRRNPLAVAQSVYFGRTRDEFTRKTWLTPHARGYEELFKKSLIEQCAGQQALFDKDIDAGLSELPAERWIEVDYDDVCTCPTEVLKRVSSFMAAHGITVQPKNTIPDSFPHSNYRRLDQEIYQKLVEYIDDIYSEPVQRLLEPDNK